MSETSKTSNAIGIDLGTTYSCCGAYINGKVEIITNPDGDRTTPSIVAFGDSGNVVVGSAAKSMYTSDPSSVVFDAKRMIGRGFDDENIQKCVSKWPFKVVRYNFQTKKEEPAPISGSQKVIDNIAIKIEKNGKVDYYAPIEISSRVLTYMKKAAEARLGTKVESVVVTVPAYFEEPQKERTKEAAIIAGFKPDNIRLLAEPTAAAMAYGHIKTQGDAPLETKEDVLVFDLGGGTFDVSVLDFEFSKENGSVGITKATDGDTFLGGVDFDNLLIQHALSDFKKKNNIDESEEFKQNSILRLRAEVTRVKALLSSTTNAQIYVPCFHGTVDLNVAITRTRFEFLCDSLFKKCLERVKGCLLLSEDIKGVNYSKDGSKLLLTPELEKQLNEIKNRIKKVIPVGGSSRIPKIKSMLCDYFGANKVVEPVNPDEAVAYGAAYQAASVFSDVMGESNGLLLIDCCPLDLSIETAGGVATVLIPRNSSIPVKKTETFTTYSDNQTAVTINVYEGNRALAKENNLIGSFNLDGIIPAPRGVPKIEVTFDVDNNGVLNITAEDKQTSKTSSLTVSNTQSRLTDEQIQRMKEAAAEHEKADEKVKQLITKKNGFETVLNSFKGAVEQHQQLPQEKKDEILEKIKPYEEWVYGLDGTNFDEEEMDRKDQELKDMIKDLMPAGGVPPSA